MKYMRWFFGCLALSGVLFSPVAGAAEDNVNYIIRGREVLRINVYDHPDLSTMVRVSEEGTITFPLVGEVSVGGLSAHGVEKKIAGLLAQGIIVNPQVTVFVEQFKAKQITLIGEVNRPGKYDLEMDQPTYVADVLSESLGLTRDAAERLIILRKRKGETSKVIVDLTRLLKEADLSQNVELEEGDFLYVPRAGYYYIYGQVNRPGYYRIEPSMTLIKAVSMAGGPTPMAATRGVRVVRTVDGKERTLRVKLNSPVRVGDEFFENNDMSQDIKMLDGDVIYVPRKEYFYVYGEVNRPGHYKMEPGLTVIKAITIAGGTNNKASTGRIKITRTLDSQKKTLEAALDDPIQGDDVIIVPESYF